MQLVREYLHSLNPSQLEILIKDSRIAVLYLLVCYNLISEIEIHAIEAEKLLHEYSRLTYNLLHNLNHDNVAQTSEGQNPISKIKSCLRDPFQYLHLKAHHRNSQALVADSFVPSNPSTPLTADEDLHTLFVNR